MDTAPFSLTFILMPAAAPFFSKAFSLRSRSSSAFRSSSDINSPSVWEIRIAEQVHGRCAKASISWGMSLRLRYAMANDLQSAPDGGHRTGVGLLPGPHSAPTLSVTIQENAVGARAAQTGGNRCCRCGRLLPPDGAGRERNAGAPAQ